MSLNLISTQSWSKENHHVSRVKLTTKIARSFFSFLSLVQLLFGCFKGNVRFIRKLLVFVFCVSLKLFAMVALLISCDFTLYFLNVRIRLDK